MDATLFKTMENAQAAIAAIRSIRVRIAIHVYSGRVLHVYPVSQVHVHGRAIPGILHCNIAMLQYGIAALEDTVYTSRVPVLLETRDSRP